MRSHYVPAMKTFFCATLVLLLGAMAFGQGATTTTTLTPSPTSIFAGQTDTFTGTVSNGTATAPTGTVTFNNGATQIGTATLDSGGNYTFATSTLPVGSDSITANYGGDAANQPSSSAAVIVTVSADPTATATASGDVTVITLTNTSPNQVTFTLNVPSNFSIATGGTCPASLQLSGGSCTVYLQASDQTGQSQSGTLSVTAVDGSGVPVNVVGGASLPLGSGVIPASGETGTEQVVTLAAGPTTTTLPDGTVVPMWGYSCGTPVVNSGATCRALNPNALGWSPVVITVPAGKDLEIELTNNLSFTPSNSTTPNNIPTSIMIVGQVGGGLGTGGTYMSSPNHSSAQSTVTWPIAGASGPGVSGTPPTQGPRVRSFGTEVAAGTTADLIWKLPRPGTYLLESGTEPSIQVPMGLIGVLVVTTPPTTSAAGTAYPALGTRPAVTYNAEIPLEFSEIDPVQNNSVNIAVHTAGFSDTAVWSGMNPNGLITGITLISAGSGYTAAPPVTITGGGGSGATAQATVLPDGSISLTLLSNGSGYTSAPTVLIGPPPAGGTQATATVVFNAVGCAAAHNCYPPAVNYTPFYYLINGVAFNKTNANGSLFFPTQGTATGVITGNVLVRMVNAGLKMHVPSIVGSQTTGWLQGATPGTVGGFTLIAEDGNPVPGPLTSGGSTLPAPRVQTDVFMAAGKTFDVMINAPQASSTGAAPAALPVYDRELSLSGNSSERDAGMLAYIGINTTVLPTFGAGIAGVPYAKDDSYPSVVPCTVSPCTPVVVSDASKGVIANDSFVYGVQLKPGTGPTNGTLTCGATPGNPVPGLCTNGTFTYTPNVGAAFTTADTFQYCANGITTICATVTLGAAAPDLAGISMNSITYTAKTATYINIPAPGPLAVDKDNMGYPLSVVTSGTNAPASGCGSLVIQPDGAFIATAATAGTSCSFTYTAQNTHGVTGSASVTLNFPQGSGLSVTVKDPVNNVTLSDYRWVIEEDKTFYVNPACTTTGVGSAACPVFGTNNVPTTFGVNFHTSHMDFVQQGCTGNNPTDLSCEQGQTMLGVPAACDGADGVCDPSRTQQVAVTPDQVVLDPGCGFGSNTVSTAPGSTCTTAAPYPKRYYISVLPGDAGNPFALGYASNPSACVGTTRTSTTGPTPQSSGGSPTCGHGMSGAEITWNTATNSWNPVTVLTEPSPYPPSKLSVQVFEDDFPLNGEQDAGGGIDVLATNEPGLGGFEIILWDAYGQLGDVTGQMTHDMFNQPLDNALAGTIDPATGLDACPISKDAITSPSNSSLSPSPTGITGRIVTCPTYESDGSTQSPLAGQAVIANLMPGKFNVQAYPAADRIARGEEWLQTNTLDGQHQLDSFLRIGEPSYFQEYGPAGFHVSIGFANPAVINARHAGVCNGTDLNLTATNCTNTVTGKITAVRMSRPPDERLYSSQSRDAFFWTQCFVSLGDPDGEDFMFTKCDANGNFTFTQVPSGSWRLSIFDQWNDQLMDGLTTPVNVANGNNQTVTMGDVPVQQWQANVYTRTFIDDNKDGIYQSDEIGIPFLNITARYRDGSRANWLTTDFTGVADFNETFPLFNWYVVESDVTRYKTTGIHVVYDAGGPPDGSKTPGCGGAYPACESGTPYDFLANTIDPNPLPSDLSVPGAIYCTSATCSGYSIFGTPAPSDWPSPGNGAGLPSGPGVSTGRIDPPWVVAEGWQGFSGQNNFIEFGKAPYADGENGGIQGHVVYASTRPFDDPSMNVQQPWEPLVPHVTINLYQEGFASDGVTPTLTLVDTTQTSSWDDWAQGFYLNPDGTPYLDPTTHNAKPYMNCPGQATTDLFYYTLYNQPNYLDLYNAYYNGGTMHTLPYNSQYKCYDAMHNWNQLQPAPYDGMYQFPSVLSITPGGASAGKEASSTSTVTGWHQLINGTTASGKYFATNCAICIPNPDASDPWRVGTPMLPPGKYVVEVVPPPGYELVKEEDKNILIGDNFIAPVTQQFGGLGDIFIIPDQASVTSMYDESGTGLNTNNAQNPTQALGASPNNQIVPGFIPEPVWPCVGQSRVVPDFMSIFPQSGEVAPFAGATRNLCDRKEVTLMSQQAAIAKFYIFTTTHIASKFAGVITDDFTSEFDPFAPVFGEKFSPPNMPISMRDWNGNETARVYSDQWGAYNGLNYSTWEVNPPNPTGYSPTMMVSCMNDKGPAIDFRPSVVDSTGATILNTNFGKSVPTDPLFNPLYSQFCYELPYMPGATDYQDTPVVPTAAMVGAGYNNPDCAYPTGTPAIASVISQDIAGPWVSAGGHTITITALGDQIVNNYGYSGPQATGSPFNQKTITRHYGFGGSGTVTVGGVPLTNVTWGDSTITGTVNLTGTVNNANVSVPQCPVQQQAQYFGTQAVSTAYCGQLVITTSTGQQSVDAVTVTIGGKQPTVLGAGQTIQSAIDAAAPGDMIIIPPGTYRELLLMWKPVRLQGVGAASAVIDASTHPAGALKLDPWRASVNCLFGLALNGQPNNGVFDSSGTYSCPAASSPTSSGTGPDGNPWNYFYGGPNFPKMIVDRIPLEGILGWDATVNGNLAEQLQEPSIMGAYEGAGITVLSKGVNIPAGSTDVFGSGAEATFPTGTTLLTGLVGPNGGMLTGDKNPICLNGTTNPATPNPYPSNFVCNPSSIDGLGITDASQGGGGIFVHAWGHNLQIANNRVFNNAGTLSGGISMGQGESPEAYLNGTAGDTDPGSCFTPNPANPNNPLYPANTQLPYCLQIDVNMHNNMIVDNSSTGDELFTGTPAGAGGISICTGSDFYKFNYNWVCGNLSTGDGGGIGHIGFSWNGDIEHNTILFNQATNPSIEANGGGLLVMGAAPDATITVNGALTECGSVTDNDCVPGLSDGTGPGLVINANLLEGNSADAGSGGGLRLQAVNGTDIARFPNPTAGLVPGSNCQSQYGTVVLGVAMLNCNWYVVSITNNIINDNVAGWDGAGVSLEDTLAAKLINNTISSNDTTASSGVLFNTLGAPLASSQSHSPICQSQGGGTASCPQPAGLVSMQNSPQLTSSFTTGAITCPAGNYSGTTSTNGTCIHVSYPALYNNIFWQNRAFQIGIGGRGPGNQNQQNIVTLHNAAFNGGIGSVAGSQGYTGACPTGASYWDLGIRNDTGPNNHGSGYTLNPLNGVLTALGSYSGTNLTANPAFASQYCNGSRVPPESQCQDAAGQPVPCGWQVPPGIADAVVPNPVFTLTPAATVDEGNNWINISWGPLSMLNPASSTGTTNVLLGNYALQPTSLAVDHDVCSSASPCVQTVGANGVPTVAVPTTDFFGNPRPDPANPNAFDIGAIEYQGAGTTASAPTLTSITPNSGVRGTSVNVTLIGTNLSAATSITVSGTGVTVEAFNVDSSTQITATFVITATAATGARTVVVTTPSGTSNSVGFTVLGPTLTSITPTFGYRGKTVAVTLTGTNLAGATAVTVSGTGVTATITGTPTATTVTANFVITATAGATARNVTVTTPIGTTNAVTFTVLAPSLTSVNPNTGLRGQTGINVTLTGVDFTGATGVTAGTGITVSNFAVVSDTSITATFAIATGTTAPLGGHTVTVVSPNGNATLANGFTVTGPSLTSINPTSGLAGTTVSVTLTGTGLTGTTSVSAGTGITVNSVAVVNDSTVTANFVIASGATAGTRSISVTNSFGGVSNTLANAFTVTRPTLSSISPTSGVPGTFAVTLTGTNLATVSTVTISGSGVTGTVTSASATSVTANFTITSAAAHTTRTVTVTTAGGAVSNSVSFVVGPMLTSINPTSATRPASGSINVPITISGTNLDGTTTLTGLGTGVTASGISASPTQVTATLTIQSTATAGTRNIGTSGGTYGASGNTVAFAVQ